MKYHLLLVAVITAMYLISCSHHKESTDKNYEAIYLERFEKVKEKGILSAYEPTEKLKGADELLVLPRANEAEFTISGDVLEQASLYAETNNSDALIVWHNGQIQLESYFGDVTRDTLLVSKSLSKPLTAIVIGRAIQLGFIESLDQPVSEFITEWKNTEKAKVLIRHLLDMRAGFLPQGYSPDPSHPWNRAYLSPDHGKVLIDEYPLVEEPGSKYLYNNATADMVALVIERASSQRFGDFVSKQILEPLGAAGGAIWVGREGGLAHSGCCKLLPAETWLRMAILLLNNGKHNGKQFLPKAYVEAMRTSTAENPHYGLGIWVAEPYTKRRSFSGTKLGPQVLHSEPYLDPNTYMFDGNSNQVVWVIPSQQLIVLRMGKTPPKHPEWDNSFLPNLIFKGLK